VTSGVRLCLSFVLPESDTLRSAFEITRVFVVVISIDLSLGCFLDQAISFISVDSLDKTRCLFPSSYLSLGRHDWYFELDSDPFFRRHVSPRMYIAHFGEIILLSQHFKLW
jgi:hypothetical protein